jgi:hypothetical protein
MRPRRSGRWLDRSAAVVDELVEPEQVYTCLWWHVGGVPVHIHYVFQQVTRALMEEHAAHGPALQVAMFERGELPREAEVALFADRARAAFAAQPVE